MSHPLKDWRFVNIAASARLAYPSARPALPVTPNALNAIKWAILDGSAGPKSRSLTREDEIRMKSCDRNESTDRDGLDRDTKSRSGSQIRRQKRKDTRELMICAYERNVLERPYFGITWRPRTTQSFKTTWHL